MKICHLCAVDFTLKRLIIPLVDKQLEAGYDVTSACSFGEHAENLRASGYQIEDISIARSLSPFKGLVTIWRLFIFFRKESFDLVHVHTPVAAFLGRIACFFARVPFVIYTAHGFYFHDEMPFYKKKLFYLAEILMRPLTSLLFTQSHEDALNAIALGIMDEEHTFEIGNGVDIKKFDPYVLYPESRIDVPSDKIVIGMISRLVQEKGIVEFLKAAQNISKSYPQVYFLLVGSRLLSDYDSNVDSSIDDAKKNLNERLILTGEREDIPGLLSSMDIFCLPSWREGMPRSIIEAMMMKLPVVATNIRGSREEVIDGETGFLVPLYDVDSLYEALERLVIDSELRKEMGSKGRARALELYDEEAVIKRQLGLIRKFIPVH